jgi:hypothetical protein
MSKTAMKTIRTGAKTDGAPKRHARADIREERVESVMAAAKRSGLLAKKSGRIACRVSPALVRQAKRRTGIKADTDLIAFALANVALEDNFLEAFERVDGTVDPELKLGY